MRNRIVPAALAFTLGILAGSAAFANPTGAQVANGQVRITSPNPNTLNITNSPGAIINWRGFSIQNGETTRFIQNSAASAILNRVSGQNPSALLGRLLSNGRVFLINRNGIVFGPHAVIDTAGLVASTLNMTDQDFIKQNLKFQGDSHSGSLENQGYIKASAGGNIFLIAPNIKNSGIIETDGGQLVLAAGQSVTLASLDSDDIVFDVQAPDNEIVNLGALLSHGGAARMFAGTIRHSGSIDADSISVDKNGKVQLFARADIEITRAATITTNSSQGGEVKIESDTGTVQNSGRIEAQGDAGEGGHVEILGERVALLEQASVDASGEIGGGEVLIGGDYQGKTDSIKNARQPYVSEAASVTADAITTDNGGKVIVWANDSARVDGHLSARGGGRAGNGGFVETSGRRLLDVTRAPDISAPRGHHGTWLLDPETITISSAASSNNTGASVLNVTTLASALNAGGTIVVDTTGGGAGTGDIFLSAALAISPAAPVTLDLKTHNNINLNATITTTGNALTLNLTPDQDLNATGQAFITAAIDTNGGTVDLQSASVATLSTGASITSGTLQSSGGGSYQVPASNSATFDGLTLDTNLTVNNASTLTVLNGLTLGASNPALTLASTNSFTSVNFNTASQTLGGTGTVVLGGSSNNNAVRPLSNNTTLTIGPSVTIRGGGTVGLSGTNRFVTNQGTLIADTAGRTLNASLGASPGATLAFTGADYIQTTGITDIGGGTLVTTGTTTGTLMINGGTLQGAGSITGNANLGAAFLFVAGSTGTTTITGDLTLTGSSILDVEFGGTVQGGPTPPGGYDHLDVTGTANLAGTLNVTHVGGFTPTVGDNFQFLTCGTACSGTFGTVNTPAGFIYDINNGANDAILTFLIAPTIFWDNGGNGIDWSDANNWSTNAVPVGSDDVLIDFGGANVVSFNTTASINSVLSRDDLTIAGGSLTLASASTISGNLSVTGGTLSNAAATVLNGAYNWSGGTLKGAGSLTTNGLTTVTGNVDVTSTTWTNAGTVDVNGTGRIRVDSGTFTNAATHIVNLNTSNAIPLDNLNPGTVNNAGILNKANTAAQTFSSGVTFNNTGTLNVNAGTLATSNITTNNGIIDVTGGILNITGTGFSNVIGATIQGSGTLDVSGIAGGMINSGTLKPGTSIGTLNVTGNVIFGTGSRLEIELGSSLASDQLAVTGNVTVNPGAELKILGSGGYTGGSGDVFPGVINTTGTLTGTFGTLTQAPSFTITPAYTLGPAGDLTLTVSNLINRWSLGASGLWSAAGNWSRGLPSSTQDVAIDTVGVTVTHASGTDAINTLDLIAGSTLILTDGSLDIANNSTLNGNLTLSGGQLSIAQTLTLNGVTNWTGGNTTAPINGGGTGILDIPSTATFNITAFRIGTGQASVLDALTVNNTGAIIYNPGEANDPLSLTTGTVINNSGSFDIQRADADITGNGVFNNSGMFIKSSGSISTASNTISFNNLGGTVDIQTGTFSLGGNPLNVDNAGTLIGNGTFAGNVVNNGMIKPGASPGILGITGNVTFNNGGSLDIELQSSTPGQFDVLNVGGTVTINPGASLNAIFFGGFTPILGDLFDIINASNISGDFTAFTQPNPGQFIAMVNFPTTGNYRLDAVTAPPPPPPSGNTVNPGTPVTSISTNQILVLNQDPIFDLALTDISGEPKQAEEEEANRFNMCR